MIGVKAYAISKKMFGPQARCREDLSGHLVAEMQLATASLYESFSSKSVIATIFASSLNCPHSLSGCNMY